MADSTGSNPKILKSIVIFIAVLFLLIIVFNIWMKASLEKTGALPTSGKPENKKPSGAATETVTPEQKTEQPENLTEDQPIGEEQLILQ